MKNKQTTLMIVIIVILVLVLLGGFNMMGGYNSGFMFLNWIFNILIIILVIAGVYWLIQNITFKEVRKNSNG